MQRALMWLKLYGREDVKIIPNPAVYYYWVWYLQSTMNQSLQMDICILYNQIFILVFESYFIKH